MIVESTISRVDIRARLKPIAKRIRLSEQKIMPPECRESVEIFGKPIFPLPGTGEAWYGPTPMLALIEYLEGLNLPPDLHFADLGSGLGNACIAARAVFDRVTGLENNRAVFAEAVTIRDEFGLAGIEYRLEDLMAASWEEFNVLYFYKPDAKEDLFLKLMRRFRGTAPGTVIISRRYMNNELYLPGEFRYLPPLSDWRSTLDNLYFPLAEFYGFVKK